MILCQQHANIAQKQHPKTELQPVVGRHAEVEAHEESDSDCLSWVKARMAELYKQAR